jgi:hypothetical protein
MCGCNDRACLGALAQPLAVHAAAGSAEIVFGRLVSRHVREKYRKSDMTELNWMGLTEAEVNAGLVQRGVVTRNFATGEPNEEAPDGAAAKIVLLSDGLRPSFLTWWRTGVVNDISEPKGMSLKKLMDGAYPIQRSAMGAFMDLDHVLKDPSAWAAIAEARPW